jgi:hypothetical protein
MRLRFLVGIQVDGRLKLGELIQGGVASDTYFRSHSTGSTADSMKRMLDSNQIVCEKYVALRAI